MRIDSAHPLVSFVFYAIALVSTLLWAHPVFAGISWVCACANLLALMGRKGVSIALLCILLPLVWSALFSLHHHFGVTVLMTLPDGNGLMLESLAFGLLQGVQAAAFIMWSTCFIRVFTVDRIVFLVGRIWPKGAMLISAGVRILPRVVQQHRNLDMGHAGIDAGRRDVSLLDRTRLWIGRISMSVSWLAEKSGAVGQSMRARGLELEHRSTYSLYRFDARDRGYVIFIFTCLSILLFGMGLDQMSAWFDPEIVINRVTASSFVFFLTYTSFLLSPVALQALGEWRFARALRRRDVREKEA